jgi:cell division protein FtsW (lipid II flippase)
MLLVLFGVGAVYSVSIHESFTYSLKFLAETTNYFYFNRHLINILIATVMAFAVSRLPLQFFKKYKNGIFVALLLFQLLVFTPLGLSLQGARGWLRIPWYGTIQPSEFFKLGFVTFFAGWLYRKKAMLQHPPWYISFLVLMGLIGALFMKIPDLGTMLVLGLVGFIMYWYAGGKLKHLLLIIVGWLVLGVGVGRQIPYVKSRLNYFVNSSTDQSGRGIWYQTEQALLSVGGWWLIGNGYGKWLQKFWYIPEAQSDFIFAAFSEEIGFMGNLFLLFLYGYMMFIFLRALPQVKDEYTRIFGVGIIATIIVQMFINIGVNIKIVPLTWLTLPFISTGGTALMVNFIQVMILYKIIYKKERIV